MVSTYIPIKSCFCGAQSISPVGFQSLMVWEPISWVGFLKVQVLDVWSIPSILWGHLGVVAPLLILCCCARVKVYGKSVFQPFPPISVWIFLFCSVAGRHSAVFQAFSQKELLCLQLRIHGKRGVQQIEYIPSVYPHSIYPWEEGSSAASSVSSGPDIRILICLLLDTRQLS